MSAARMGEGRMYPAKAGMAEMSEDVHERRTICKGRQIRWAAGAMTVAALCLASGCSGFFVYPGSTGSGGGTGSTGDYVYVANASTTNLAGFTVGTGTLTAVANSPYALAISPTAVVINPTNTLLYVAGGSAIYAYAIQSGGVLSVLNGGSPVASATVQAMDISPDGQWLLALDRTAGVIDEYRINTSTGGLSGQTVNYPATNAQPMAIKVAPNAQFVFAALGTAGDVSFSFATASGSLGTPVRLTPPPGTSDNGLAVDPTSTYVYIARSPASLGGGLAVYSIGLGGALGLVSGSPYTAGSAAYSVTVNKTGTDVYVANRTDGTISGFSIGSGGALTALSGSPYTSGAGVTALAIDNSGNYLLAAAFNGSPDLTLYSFDSITAGKLDFAASSATGADPTGAIALATTH